MAHCTLRNASRSYRRVLFAPQTSIFGDYLQPLAGSHISPPGTHVLIMSSISMLDFVFTVGLYFCFVCKKSRSAASGVRSVAERVSGLLIRFPESLCCRSGYCLASGTGLRFRRRFQTPGASRFASCFHDPENLFEFFPLCGG